MSKKKSFSGSTMTLKDFHGGSIPSDLPLPSAPGVTAKPPDRSWGTTVRPENHRPRPGSAGSGASVAHAFDDRGPSFLSQPSFIGRHFDEDERKPFDASSTSYAPRRPATEPVRSPPPPSTAPKRQPPSPPHQSPSTAVVAPAFHPPSAGSATNAWAARKEAATPDPPPRALPTASRVASAVDVISSGRWNSKPTDVDSIRFHEAEHLERRTVESLLIAEDGDHGIHGYQKEKMRSANYPEDKERNPVMFYDNVRVRSPVYPEAKERNLGGYHSDLARDHGRSRSPLHLDARERNLVGFHSDAVRDHGMLRSPVYPEAKERNSARFHADAARTHERARSPVYLEIKEKNTAGFYSEAIRPTSSEDRSNGPQLSQQGSVEVLERPKLKLLPRTKPLDSSETWFLDDKQVYEPQVDSVCIDNGSEIHGSMNMPKPGSAGADSGSTAVERPRLNLKPRSQPFELDGTAEKERKSLFGGARPRELVLKERGIDTTDANNFEISLPANRGIIDSPRSNIKLQPNNEKLELHSLEQWNVRELEKRDHRPEADKATTWRNSKEVENPVDPRRQEHDTWRKPVEQMRVETHGPRFGRAASALELAQAFSRSASDAGSDGRYTTQRSLPSRTQVPFSRLTDTQDVVYGGGHTQRQINGY